MYTCRENTRSTPRLLYTPACSMSVLNVGWARGPSARLLPSTVDSAPFALASVQAPSECQRSQVRHGAHAHGRHPTCDRANGQLQTYRPGPPHIPTRTAAHQDPDCRTRRRTPAAYADTKHHHEQAAQHHTQGLAPPHIRPGPAAYQEPELPLTRTQTSDHHACRHGHATAVTAPTNEG